MKIVKNIPRRNKQLLKGLEDMCKYLKYNGVESIIEVGAWCGSASYIFSKNFKTVICIDPWESTKNTISDKYRMQDVEDEFDKVLKKCNNIMKIKGRFEDVNISIVDAIYIDAEHTYTACKRDIEKALQYCSKFICGHDYWPGKFPGVVKAVNELLGSPDKKFCDSSWVRKIYNNEV